MGLFLGVLSVPAWAQLSLYDDDFLAYWSAITPADVRAVYAEDLLPALSAEERRRLEGVELSFPLRCPFSLEPFCYYLETRPGGEQRLVMSVASLRLYGDLALATAWLQLTDHAIDTPGRYLTMLRHQRAAAFPGERYPEPLSALGIPEEVRDQPEIMGLYGKIYTSSVVFILLHELGHALHRHPGYGPELSREQARRHEVEADDFALEVMARLGYPPLGMSVFFTLLVHWEPNRWHFADGAAYQAYLAEATHPLTSDRLRQLATALADRGHDFARAEPDYAAAQSRVSGAAQEIGRLADFMDDRDIQEGILRLGRATDLASLKPKGTGELSE